MELRDGMFARASETRQPPTAIHVSTWNKCHFDKILGTSSKIHRNYCKFNRNHKSSQKSAIPSFLFIPLFKLTIRFPAHSSPHSLLHLHHLRTQFSQH